MTIGNTPRGVKDLKPSEKKRAKKIGAQAYDRVAKVWDRSFVPATAAARQRLLELAQLKPGERVLDIGTGTGRAARLAARRVGRSGFVLGIDVSAAMLKIARANVAKQRLNNVEFRLMDAASLKLRAKSFDAVISSFGSPDAPWDAGRSLAEWWRVLVPGGRLCFCDGAEDKDKVEATFRQVFEKHKVANPGRELASRRQLKSRISEETKGLQYFDFNDASKVARLIESAGFKHVRHLTETFVATLPSARALLDLLLSWDYAAEYAEMPRQVQLDFRREVVLALRAFETPKGLSWPNDVNFFLARRGEH